MMTKLGCLKNFGLLDQDMLLYFSSSKMKKNKILLVECELTLTEQRYHRMILTAPRYSTYKYNQEKQKHIIYVFEGENST